MALTIADHKSSLRKVMRGVRNVADPTTGYRSYAPEQLFLLNHILVLMNIQH